MCSVWQHQTEPDKEFEPGLLEKLPALKFCNITGGEPFIREDLGEIVRVVRSKARRVVISTNGYFTDRVIDVARENPGLGVRISLEGLPAANDQLRGLKDGFDRGLRTLLELIRLGVKDVGLGITVSDRNADDLLELSALASSMGLEFATAAVHNSFYFHKFDNRIEDTEKVAGRFEELSRQLLGSRRPKDWFRAYFNHGLANYVRGEDRLLPCEAGSENFFVDPAGEILPCNGLDPSCWFETMGNLHQNSFEEIWNGARAAEVRARVKSCPRNCWMIGTAAPVMKKYIWRPAAWILRQKVTGKKA
jgi:radical SAM protein with 4Fe4S-binding SPASM domain